MDPIAQIAKATHLSYVRKYQEAAETLHALKKTVPATHPAVLLIDVKLSRCYEYLDDADKCALYWDRAGVQIDQNSQLNGNQNIFKLGLAEYCLNELRGLQATQQINKMAEKIMECEIKFTIFQETIQNLQFLFLKAKYYLNTNEDIAHICDSAIKISTKLIEMLVGGDNELEIEANCEARNYLKDYQKQIQSLKFFSSIETHKEQEVDEEDEEEKEDDFEEVQVMDK